MRITNNLSVPLFFSDRIIEPFNPLGIPLSPGGSVIVDDEIRRSEAIKNAIGRGDITADQFSSAQESSVVQADLDAISGTLSGTYFKDGGNSFAELAELGTNDDYDLLLRRNGSEFLGLLENATSNLKSVRVDDTVDYFCLGHELDEVADASLKTVVPIAYQGQLLDITEGSKSYWKNIVVSDVATDCGAIHFFKMRGNLAAFSDVQIADNVFNINGHAQWSNFPRTTLVISNTIDSITNWPSSSIILGLYDDQPLNKRTNVFRASPGEFVVNSGEFAANRDVNFKVLDGASFSLFSTNASSNALSFFGVSEVGQQSGTGETVGFTAGAGTPVNDGSTFTGNVGATAYRISDVVKALKNYGLLAL